MQGQWYENMLYKVWANKWLSPCINIFVKTGNKSIHNVWRKVWIIQMIFETNHIFAPAIEWMHHNIDTIKNCILFTRIIIVLPLVKIQSVISSTSIQQNWYAWVVCFWAFYRQSCNSMGDVIGMWRTYCNAER